MKKIIMILVGLSMVSCSSGQKRSDGYEQAMQDMGAAPSDGMPDSSQLASSGQPKKKVAVFSFWNDTPVFFRGIESFTGNELKRLLFATQRVIISRDAQSQIETKDLVSGGNIKVAQLIREARRMGVSVAVVGRIGRIVFRQQGEEVGLFRRSESRAAVDVEVKVFDVNGGREISAFGRSGESNSSALSAFEEADLSSPQYRQELTQLALRDALNRVAPQILRVVEKMAWRGAVAKIIGNKIYLSSGRKSGLVAGDILKVLTPGKDVYEPSSGAYLGRTKGELKGTLEVIDFLGEDSAVSVIHTGGNFQQGDTVRLY